MESLMASPELFDERLRDVELVSQRNTDRIGSHEELCAERYKTINDSIASMQSVLMKVGALLLTGMAGVLVKLVFFP